MIFHELRVKGKYFYLESSFDIALLKLETPATLGDTVSPPCLPHYGDYGDESSYAPGNDTDDDDEVMMMCVQVWSVC